MNSSGTVVVEYAYDAWGKPMGVTGSMAGTLGAANPFRYRGYYYDAETGLYYLNERYYNPEWCRFINADDFGGVTGGLLTHNIFIYCANNPVMKEDPDGNFFNLIAAAVGGAIGAAVGFVSNGVSNVIQGKDFTENWEAATIGGAVSGAVAGLTGGASLIVSAVISSAAGSIAEEAVHYIKRNEGYEKFNLTKSLENVGINTFIGATSARIGGRIGIKQVVKSGPWAWILKLKVC